MRGDRRDVERNGRPASVRVISGSANPRCFRQCGWSHFLDWRPDPGTSVVHGGRDWIVADGVFVLAHRGFQLQRDSGNGVSRRASRYPARVKSVHRPPAPAPPEHFGLHCGWRAPARRDGELVLRTLRWACSLFARIERSGNSPSQPGRRWASPAYQWQLSSSGRLLKSLLDFHRRLVAMRKELLPHLLGRRANEVGRDGRN